MDMIVCEDCGNAGHTNLQCERCVNKMNQLSDEVELLGPVESKRVHNEVLGAIKRDRSARNGLSESKKGRTK